MGNPRTWCTLTPAPPDMVNSNPRKPRQGDPHNITGAHAGRSWQCQMPTTVMRGRITPPLKGCPGVPYGASWAATLALPSTMVSLRPRRDIQNPQHTGYTQDIFPSQFPFSSVHPAQKPQTSPDCCCQSFPLTFKFDT